MSNLNVINTLAHTLTDSELADAINMLVVARKARQGDQLLEMKSTLVKGDIVEFYHSAQKQYIRGTVKKVKTKKALIWEDGHSTGPAQTWDVPMGMLRKC